MSADKSDKAAWKAVAEKESRGRDLTRETVEGITLQTVYGPDDWEDASMDDWLRP